MDYSVLAAVAAAAVLILAIGAVHDDRRARARRKAPPRIELPLLHSLNEDRCIGCEACVDVCPTQVLDLVHHKVQVARFSDCVQCEQCANSCPTTALVMYRQGEQPKTLTVPELDEHFQTSVPGQYLIGEVAGKPLVKNAANLGRAVVEHIARSLGTARAAGAVDVIVVGSGPAGLSAALTCVKRGLSCVVLEKDHVISSTVSRYPKGKLFMAEPSRSHNLSFLPVFDASKEELVAAWRQVIDGAGVTVKLGEAVERVKKGDDGVFAVDTTVASYRGRAVVLATGLRGKPRLLAVPGANLEKVQSRLDDPDAVSGRDVLVVGGGDSAVEGAMSLADAGARVTLSYRGDSFKRCKQANQQRLAAMQAAGALEVLLESNVKELAPDAVTITCKGGEVITRANQHAFVLIGADTPVAWLESVGVRFVERPHLYALGSTDDVIRRLAPDATPCPPTAAAALAILRGEGTRRRLRTVVDVIEKEATRVRDAMSGMFQLTIREDGEESPHVQKRVRAQTPIPVAPPPVRAGATTRRATVRPGFDTRATTPVPAIKPRTPPLRAPTERDDEDTRVFDRAGEMTDPRRWF